MKFNGFITGRNQLQWAVLLLAIAVVLPTVCLVWFMTQVIKNERLVVRQKLMDIYEGQTELLNRQIDDLWAERTRFLSTLTRSNLSPCEIFAAVIEASDGSPRGQGSSGIVICDSNGNLLYPIIDRGGESFRPLAEFTEAWNAEFIENDTFKAAHIYSQIAESHPNSYTGCLASMGKIRCLNKAGEIENAIRQCRSLAYNEHLVVAEPASAALISQARLQLIALKKAAPGGLIREDVIELVNSAINYSGDPVKGYLPLTSNDRIFFLSKSLEIIKDSPWSEQLKKKTILAERFLAAEQNTAEAVDVMHGSIDAAALTRDASRNVVNAVQTVLGVIESNDWPERLKSDINQVKEILDTAQQHSSAAPDNDRGKSPVESRPQHLLFKLQPDSNLFGLYHSTPNRIFLFLCSAEQVRSDFKVIEDKLASMGLAYRMTDSTGAFVAGLEKSRDKPFIASKMGRYFTGWQIFLFAGQDDAFQKAASRRIALYVWAGILVIILIFLAGGFATQTVRKQIQLNKMKNDFIATVSHELKTPLASMRVLVDTLLEGNIKDEGQTEEYLRMTSKENERLSRMIDNFLTFSRMERNKKVFNIAPANPALIANDAAEAVKTKYSSHNCGFKLDIAQNLPEISADHDAIVTVIVNLLDNACKYTGDDKDISLKVFKENHNVCFIVADNGIGIARRHIRKIFDRFYQVDISLARKAEGCGLGLSIVKFIVDAHKGKISVESKPGKGSTFTVKIPVSAAV